METFVAHEQQTTQQSPEDMYWVFTPLGANVLGKMPGAVISADPYRAPENWVRKGYVTPEEME